VHYGVWQFHKVRKNRVISIAGITSGVEYDWFEVCSLEVCLLYGIPVFGNFDTLNYSGGTICANIEVAREGAVR